MLHLSLPERPGIIPGNTKVARRTVARALEDMNVRAKFSPALIADLRPPVDRHEAFCWDTDLRGWGVRILKSGRRSWVVQYRHRARSIRRTIGSCDRLPFTLARERAKQILALSGLGRDWFAEEAARIAAEQAAQEAETADDSLGAKLAEYLADPTVKNFKTYATVSRYLTKVWLPLHATSAETITSKEISRHLEKIAVDNGVVVANRARSVLFTAFKWLLDVQRLDRDDNPVARARRWKEPGRRRRAPNLQELGKIWEAAGKVYPETFGAIVRLLLLLAARRNEIALLTRGEVDLERAEITLAPARVKTNQPHWIPLSRPAVRLLRALPERRGARLFPAIAWSRCKRQIDEVSGVADWTLHDLRRSFASIARDELHADGEVVERALGHIPPGVRGKYDFSARLHQRRQLAEAWAQLVLKAAGEPTEAPALRVVS